MKFEKILFETQKAIGEMNVTPDNLINAIVKLLEITHAHGLDADAVKALSDCGITLEISEV